LRYVLNQLGEGHAEGHRYFVERFQRRIVLWVVPDDLDRFEVDISNPL
jgi:hypothetical protein